MIRCDGGSGCVAPPSSGSPTEMNIAELQKWIGRTETISDQITPMPMAALSATLDLDSPTPQLGDRLPPLWHWLYFLSVHRQSELGPEGHSIRGRFLPPVPLPRRMWAGGTVTFHHPLLVGANYTRTSRILDVQQKEGRTGPLVFVAVHHEIGNAEGLALIEEQDIVYRDHSKSGKVRAAPQPAPQDEKWERTIRPDDMLLFRYSALTFNAHRIHYDYRYATEIEGYPGLVVHGPLIATLLVDLVRRQMPEANLTRFAFRAISALFDTAPFSLCGKPEATTISLWARNSSGGLATTATATIR
jgi:3-methylfumaryl-CoA hydratase